MSESNQKLNLNFIHKIIAQLILTPKISLKSPNSILDFGGILLLQIFLLVHPHGLALAYFERDFAIKAISLMEQPHLLDYGPILSLKLFHHTHQSLRYPGRLLTHQLPIPNIFGVLFGGGRDIFLYGLGRAAIGSLTLADGVDILLPILLVD